MKTMPAIRDLSNRKRNIAKRVSRLANRDALIQDRLAEKTFLKQCINKFTRDGKVGFAYRSMDCDGVEVRGVTSIRPSVSEFLLRESKLFEDAEGPTFAWVELPKDYRDSRDRVMEAHENGHPHLI